MRCGLLEYELELQLHYRATTIEYLTGDVLFLGWLYIVGSRLLYPLAPRWPDMEFVLYKQEQRLFYGGYPKTVGEAGSKLDLARGGSVVDGASDRRSKYTTTNKKNLRRLEDQSALGKLFMYRITTEPKDTAAAHEWVSRLIGMICKPDSQKILDSQENLPQGTYEQSDFFKSAELQRNPLALLEQLRYWLLADAMDLHFDMFGMIRTCTDIWNTMLPVLRETSSFRKNTDDLSWPDKTLRRILETTHVAQAVGLPSPVFEKAWNIMQDAIHRPMSEEEGRKHWVADARLVQLMEDCDPTLVLMNPGPASFMNLYANWSKEAKTESRVGTAVWNAMHVINRKTTDGGEESDSAHDTEEDGDYEEQYAHDESDGYDEESEDAGDGEDDGEEGSVVGSDISDAFSMHEITLDLTKIPQGQNNVIFVGNGGYSMIGTRDQLSQAPDGSLVVNAKGYRGTSRVALQESRKYPTAHPIAAGSESLEPDCACGLSRYGVSLRPISVMTTKGSKTKHQCMGELFEGVGIPMDAVKVTTERVKFKRPERSRVGKGGTSKEREKAEHDERLKRAAAEYFQNS